MKVSNVEEIPVEIIRQGYIALEAPSQAPCSRGIIADRGLMDWTGNEGTNLLHCELDELNHRLSQFSNNFGTTSAYVINFGESITPNEFNESTLKIAGQAWIGLLNWAVQSGHPVHLILVATEHNLVMPLLSGLLQSLSLENKRISFTDIRLKGKGADCQEMITSDWLNQACHLNTQYAVFYQSQWYQRTLQNYASSVDESQTAEITPRDTFVLFGGAGGIGKSVCRELSSRFNCNLVIVGRSALSKAHLESLKQAGAKTYIRADVTDYVQISELLTKVQQRFGRIDYIFHLAAHLDDCLFSNVTEQRLLSVLRPKVLTAVNLANLANDFPDLKVVNFSSYTSVVGNIGQSAYGAANYFLDRLSGRFEHWYSVNWGLWDTDGMQMEDGNMLPIAPKVATNVLLKLLSQPAKSIAIIAQKAAEENPARAVRDIPLTGLPEATALWLKDIVLRISKFKHISDQASLIDSGLDSVSLINVTSRIEQDLAEFSTKNSVDQSESPRISKSLLFEASTIEQLSDWLIKNYPKLLAALLLDSAAPTQVAEPLPVNTHVSQADIEQWLLAKVIRISGLKGLKAQTNLLDDGIDSVLSIRISTDINQALSAADPNVEKLSRAIIFEYPTVADLAGYILHKYAFAISKVLSDKPPKNNESAITQPEVNQDLSSITEPVSYAKKAPIFEQSVTNVPAGNANVTYRDDDIAIIGMAGEFPNGDNIESFWQSLLNGEDAVEPIPAERWDWQQDYTSDQNLQERLNTSGGSYSRHGGFINHPDEFDCRFFNIPPAEAPLLDPQERRFVQTAYQALEDAGYFIDPHKDVAVFVAAMFGHYQDLMSEKGAISSSFSSIANRVSYSCDLTGPSIAVDSMCSGSLSALHFACNSLRLGEARWAIAGGVNIMAHPGKYRVLSQGKFVSPTGHCHAFGISADGYVPGEGVAAVILTTMKEAKRLSAKGIKPYAVIKATALNSGGKVSSFTVPSPVAQTAVISKALQLSGLEADQISYIEAHGTGTSLGDPIEVTALNNVYKKHSNRVCYLGSVKSNIGHLESTAAMAGLFKIVRQLQHRKLAPTLHAAIENPWLNLDSTRFKLVKEKQDWTETAFQVRSAALSSFGAGGSNGHAILQEYTEPENSSKTAYVGPMIFPISGINADALQRKKAALVDYLQHHPEVELYRLSYTLCCARKHFSVRDCYIANEVTELTNQIQGNVPVEHAFNLSSIKERYLSGEKTNFLALFSEQGSESPLLIRALYYPFEAVAYWAESLTARRIFGVPDDSMDSALMHPLWHEVKQGDLVSTPTNYATAGAILVVGENALAKHISAALQRKEPEAAITRQVSVDQLQLHFERIFSEISSQSVLVLCVDTQWQHELILKFMQQLQKHKHPISTITLSSSDSKATSQAYGGMFRGLAQENSHISASQVYWQLPENKPNLIDEVVSGILRKGYSGLSGAQEYTRWRVIENAANVEWQQQLQTPLALVADQQRLKQDGVYIITGGSGMIGSAVAKQLIQDYRATVVLTGRSGLSPEKQKQISDLGISAHYYQADITHAFECKELISYVIAQFGKLNGVIQSAGLLRDSLVQNKTIEEIQAVWSVKVQGTINLDKATSHLPLDFFCVFSSLASQLGNVGQSDYIAANQFLDVFAQQRNQKVKESLRQGHTLSINWPLWLYEQDGQPESLDYNQKYGALADYFWQEVGIQPFTPNTGAESCISWINGAPEAASQLMGFKGDVRKIYQSLIPGFLRPDANVSIAAPGSIAVGVSNKNLTQIAPIQSKNIGDESEILTALLNAVVDKTQLSVDEINRGASWGDLGFNSVMIQSFSTDMQDVFGVNVPPTAMFSYNSIEKLAAYLFKQYGNEDISNNSEAVVSSNATSQDEMRFAIVGISGKLPGGEELDDFWQLLIENRSAIAAVERWDSSDYYAGIISDIDKFDAKFFGMSAREAMLMDPQHRLFLQSGYNAILDAGYTPQSLQNVGVFAGVQFNDYQTLLQMWGQSSHPYAATGNAHAMLANRVSYLLNFSGPSQTIDTACSSALVALNRAVVSLKLGECDVALVGATSLLIDPTISDAAQSMGVLSPDYRCATFDKSANGYVRAEGVGCLLVKPLAQAISDRDSLYAVIENIAENHGGKANSLTSPNPNAQYELLKKVYKAPLAERVSYVETHGTGTELGDPIEIDALKQAFKKLSPNKPESSIALGAVKTNVGHLEPAAAIASLMKVIYSFKENLLPANINFNEQNPLIDLHQTPFRLLKENESWNRQENAPRVAGISSFGFGGSNAHVVLSEPEFTEPENKPVHAGYLITLSAKSLVSLKGMWQSLINVLNRSDPPPLGNVAYTLAVGRPQFEYRLCWLVESGHDLKMQLQSTDFSVVTRLKVDKQNTLSPNPANFIGDDYLKQLESLRDAFLSGVIIDWQPLFQEQDFRRVHLPGYVFDTKRYWFEQAADSERMKEVNHGK